VTGYIPRWFTRPQMVTHPSTNPAVYSQELNWFDSSIHEHLCFSAGDRQTDNSTDIDMDSDLMAELTCGGIVTASLSPSLFDSVSDSCADDVLTLESGDVLPDISTLEEFMDLTEFFVSSTVSVPILSYFHQEGYPFSLIVWFI